MYVTTNFQVPLYGLHPLSNFLFKHVRYKINIVKGSTLSEEKERAKVVKEILEKEAGSGYIDMSSESGGAGVNTTNT